MVTLLLGHPVHLFNALLFRSHFRVTPDMFDVIINEIHGYLLAGHGGGTEQINSNKQLLVYFIWQTRNR